MPCRDVERCSVVMGKAHMQQLLLNYMKFIYHYVILLLFYFISSLRCYFEVFFILLILFRYIYVAAI